MSFLHQLRIVHRDLKSENVLLDAQSNAKIADLGQSVQLEGSFVTIYRAYGDARYRPPEQFADADDDIECQVTERADIWSFGCIMLELLTVTRPWADLTYDELVQSVAVEGKAPNIPTNPRFDPMMVQVIGICFNYYPALRPSAAFLVTILQHLAQ